MAILGELFTSAEMSGSVYLTNNQRIVLQCDSVVPKSVAATKAQAYADRTGKNVYIDGIGVTTPTVAPGGDEPVAKAKTTTKTKAKKAD